MVAAACAVALAACGGTETPPTTPTPYVSPADPTRDCPLLLECHGASVADRCPEAFLEFYADTAEISPRTVVVLERLVAEVRATPQVKQLRLAGFASPSEEEGLAGERAAAIRDWLIAEGVPDQLLDITSSVSERDQTTYVAVEVTDCGAGTDEANGRSPIGALSNVLY